MCHIWEASCKYSWSLLISTSFPTACVKYPELEWPKDVSVSFHNMSKKKKKRDRNTFNIQRFVLFIIWLHKVFTSWSWSWDFQIISTTSDGNKEPGGCRERGESLYWEAEVWDLGVTVHTTRDPQTRWKMQESIRDESQREMINSMKANGPENKSSACGLRTEEELESFSPFLSRCFSHEERTLSYFPTNKSLMRVWSFQWDTERCFYVSFICSLVCLLAGCCMSPEGPSVILCVHHYTHNTHWRKQDKSPPPSPPSQKSPCPAVLINIDKNSNVFAKNSQFCGLCEHLNSVSCDV